MTFAPNLDFNRSAALRDVSDVMNALIDAACIAQDKADYEQRGKGNGDVAYKRIGAGYIGLKCDRELAFKYHRWDKEDRPDGYPKGRLQRHAQAGHWTEARTAQWLEFAGFGIQVCATDSEGNPVIIDGKSKQLGFMTAKNERGQARIAGEFDGVIHSLPAERPDFIDPDTWSVLEKITLPCLWESKKATTKKYKKFKKDGVKKSDPKYYGQLQTNMAYTGMTSTLFSMLDLDSMEYYWELVKPDIELAQRLTDRAVRVLQSETPFEFAPLSTRPQEWFECKFCDYPGACEKGSV